MSITFCVGRRMMVVGFVEQEQSNRCQKKRSHFLMSLMKRMMSQMIHRMMS
jgi:hypothetical protein